MTLEYHMSAGAGHSAHLAEATTRQALAKTSIKEKLRTKSICAEKVRIK